MVVNLERVYLCVFRAEKVLFLDLMNETGKTRYNHSFRLDFSERTDSGYVLHPPMPREKRERRVSSPHMTTHASLDSTPIPPAYPTPPHPPARARSPYFNVHHSFRFVFYTGRSLI